MMCMYLNISPKPNVYPIHLTTYSYWNHIQPLRLIPAMFRAPSFADLRKFGSFISRDVDTSGKNEQPPSGPITHATQTSTTDSDIQDKPSPLPSHAVVTGSSSPVIPEKPITKRASDPHELLLQQKQKDKGGQSEHSYNKTLNPYEIETRIEQRVITRVDVYIEAIRTEMSKMEEQIHQIQEMLGGRRKNNKTESGSKGIFRLLRSKI
ncbi:hypothetical protein HanPSC8_Chr01g0044411 [Helianthus annuus]|nr:hypothetical protein HanIR_Chr01g0049791 [Helianthus annuus]KAJ0958937.1 hypothetical protein HanPSC8_Chr01g0044411 [Helianthus annuus]